jgi:hypothetical protein
MQFCLGVHCVSLSPALHCSYLIEYLHRASWVGFGSYHAKNETVAWRMPLALACFSPALMLILLYWVPESPRFLCMRDRFDEAWELLRRIHHDPNDPTDASAHAEYTQIRKQLEFEKTAKTGYLQMFTKPTWRKRTLLAIFVSFSLQSTGNQGKQTLSLTTFIANSPQESLIMLC